MPSETKFWIVEKFDSAIMGYISGSQKQNTMAGPFDSYEEAMEIKLKEYRSFGCYYYTIKESKEKPQSSNNSYKFVDADREFDDC